MKDVEFMSANEKILVLKDWGKFLEALLNDTGETFIDKHGNRLPILFQYFTKRLYEHLHLHCSFIAHYNHFCFFETYFIDPKETIKFIQQFDSGFDCRSIEIGGLWWLNGDYEDINKAMCKIMDDYKVKLYEKYNKQIKKEELEIAELLATRHGFKLEKCRI